MSQTAVLRATVAPKRYDGPTIAQAARSMLKNGFSKCHQGHRFIADKARPWTIYATSTESGAHIVLEVHATCAQGHTSITSCFLDLEGWRS